MASLTAPQFPTSSGHRVGGSESTLAIATEETDDAFKDQPVELDHDLWKDYVEKAELFDNRMIDEWNKIVDVILVYVALFISVLTSFAIETSKQLKRDPVDISNDLLVAIYRQGLAQSTNTTSPPLNLTSILTLDKYDYDLAVVYNSLLYNALALCIVVSVIAVAAKLWLVAYGQRASSGGTPYQRAMKRQEAYSGVLAWKMGTVINSLPLILLLALIMFAFFIHQSVLEDQKNIGYAVGTIIAVGLIALGMTSLPAAFVPACPFETSFSTIIAFVFKHIEIFLGKILLRSLSPRMARWLRIAVFTFMGVASGVAIIWATLIHSSAFTSLICVPVAFAAAYSMLEPTVDHKSQKHKLPSQKHMLPLLCFIAFCIIAPTLAIAGYFRNPEKYPFFVSLNIFGMFVLLIFGWIASGLSKSMTETGEIDALAWLLETTPTQSPALFKKASQIASNGDYKSRLLRSLMPLLSSLITSHRTTDKPVDPKLQSDLETYVSCLAELSSFTDDKGSVGRLWEDAKSHPKLEEALREKLEILAETRDVRGLGRAAADVLHNFNSDGQGEKLAMDSMISLVDLGRKNKHDV